MCFGSSEKYWSSFAAATLPFPPRLTVLLKESRKIIYNRRETLVNLDSSIQEMNRNKHHPAIPTQLAPPFHTCGIRTRKGKNIFGPRYLMVSWIMHRLSEQREDKPKDMVHLEDRASVRMSRFVVNYFKTLYRITLGFAKSKNEGLALVIAGSKRQYCQVDQESREHIYPEIYMKLRSTVICSRQ